MENEENRDILYCKATTCRQINLKLNWKSDTIEVISCHRNLSKFNDNFYKTANKGE
jgi:hypothetical protein